MGPALCAGPFVLFGVLREGSYVWEAVTGSPFSRTTDISLSNYSEEIYEE